MTMTVAPESRKLLFQFARRVQRIDVDDDQAGAQHREEDDRIGNEVRQHDADALAAAGISPPRRGKPQRRGWRVPTRRSPCACPGIRTPRERHGACTYRAASSEVTDRHPDRYSWARRADRTRTRSGRPRPSCAAPEDSASGVSWRSILGGALAAPARRVAKSAAQESLRRQCRAECRCGGIKVGRRCGWPDHRPDPHWQAGGDGRGRSDACHGRPVCLVLLLAYDRPFAFGGVTITPAAFREIMVD